MRNRRLNVLTGLVIVPSALLTACASANEPPAADSNADGSPAAEESSSFPERDIEFIVPFNAGGSSDLIGRALASVSDKYLGVNTTVLNMGGGSTSIGLTEVINSEPDGYTIGTFNNGGVQLPLTIETPYDYYDVMTPIAQIAEMPYVIAVGADSPWKDLKDLADDIAARPNEITSGPAAAGGGTHFELEKLALDEGSDVRSVIFDGGAPAITALLGGNVDASVQSPSDVKAHVEAGTLRILAVLGEERLSDSAFADIPTAKEQGYDLISMLWQGVAGPADMDPAALSVLEDYFAEVVEDESVVKTITSTGMEMSYLDGDEFGKKWDSELAYYSKVFEELGDRLLP